MIFAFGWPGLAATGNSLPVRRTHSAFNGENQMQPTWLIRRGPMLFFGATVALAALAPWWRNHAFLRDFYDYGLVIAGVGRIEAGEYPYADFLTPIQTGLFLLNGWAQQLGDGTYQAMTWGVPWLAVMAVGLLAMIYAQRCSSVVAAAMAGVVTVMTVTQHTIIWHNSVGAICLAVATAGAALAPVLRRSQLGWHVLIGAALVLGGINKLNAHLVTLCGVIAWALLSGFARQASWRRVSATLLYVLVCGVVLPVLIELAWTGASLRTWWYNVVALPFGSRAGDFTAALQWKFYFTTRHDYYGPLPFQPLGALGVLSTAAFAVHAFRERGWRQGGWVLGATAFAAASGAGLLATNYEIAYVAMGAWFALIASLWLGFGLNCSGRVFYGSLIAPALVVGAFAWQSAWHGQRSQFGYSQAARSTYVAGETTAPGFGYLRGTLLPPEIAASLTTAARWRASLSPEDRAKVFYGPGLEWLDHPWPTSKLPAMPLWLHGGTSYGAAEEARLFKALSAGGPYRHVLVPEARDHWPAAAAREISTKYLRHHLGPVWYRYEQLTPGVVSWRPIDFLRAFGGNVDATLLQSTMEVHALADGRTFVGADRGRGEMLLQARSYRAAGEALLCRVPGASLEATRVPFKVFMVVGDQEHLRWSSTLVLPAGESEVVVPFGIDSGGQPVRFVFDIPAEATGRVRAGWRALTLLHAADGPDLPPMLRPDSPEAKVAGADMGRALLPAGWNPEKILVRDVRMDSAGGMVLLPGGEVWIRLGDYLADFRGVATVAKEADLPANPVVRVFYYKGGKLEMQAQSVVQDPERRFEFNAWSAENYGWLVITLDPVASVPPVSVKLLAVKIR